MSVSGNWKVYKDPTFRRSPTPAGRTILFRVKTLDSLRWLVTQAAVERTFLIPARRWLIGYAAGGEECAQLDETRFHVGNGLGRVQVAGDCKLSDLRTNPGFESFLLDLVWGSAFGWPSEMHVLALAAGREQDIGVYDGQL